MYRAAPVSSAGSSVRSTRVPRIEPAIAATYRSPVGPSSRPMIGRRRSRPVAGRRQMPNGAARDRGDGVGGTVQRRPAATSLRP